MGTSDLNFYINKHRKAYEERLKREQQNLQGKTSEGEAEKVAPSEVAKGDTNEQPNEAESCSKNLSEGYCENTNQSDATRNSTRDENINQVDADYLFALKLNEALNGHDEPSSVVNENHLSSEDRNEDAEDDVRKPDNSYVECLLGDNSYMPFCMNYDVGRNTPMNQNPLSPSGRNRRSGHYVDNNEGGHMYGPYNLRSRNNRVNGFQNGNQSSSNADRRYSPRFNGVYEPINISLSSDEEEAEVQVNNEEARSYVFEDDGVRNSSEICYVPDENLSLTPRQNKPSGQSNVGRPFSTRGEDLREEVTIIEGMGQEAFSRKGPYHHEKGKPEVCIQAHKGKGGKEDIPRVMESTNNFSFQSVGAQGAGGTGAGHYNNYGAGVQSPKCKVEKSVNGLCDVYNDHFGVSSRGKFRLVRSAAAAAATEAGHTPREGEHNRENNLLRNHYGDSSRHDDYSQEGGYYVHYAPMSPSGKEKEKNKFTFEGVYDVDSYGERVDKGSNFLSRGKNRNGGGEERTQNVQGGYYNARVQDGNDVIPLEGEDVIGSAPSPYKARTKKSKRKVNNINQVDRNLNDEGSSPKMVQRNGSPLMSYTLRSSRKHPANEKIEDPYYCKGDNYEAQNGGGLGGVPEDDLLFFKTAVGKRSEPHDRNNPTMGVCNNGGHAKSGMTYADVGWGVMQGESSPFNMFHFEQGTAVEPSVNDYVMNNVVMEMDDRAEVFAKMADKYAPVEKSSRRLPFESVHHGGEVPSVGATAPEGSLHSRRNEHPELFNGIHFKQSERAITRNHGQDDISVNSFHYKDGGLSQGGGTHRLRNFVEEGNWSDASPDRSSVLRGAHFSHDIPSSSRMVKPLCDENPPHNEFLLANGHDTPNYQMLVMNREVNYQHRPEEKNTNEGHYRHVNKDRSLHRSNGTSHNQFITSGKSPFVCTLGEAQGRAVPDVYVIDEGTTCGEPRSTHEQSLHHNMGGYGQGIILNKNAQEMIGDVKRENAGSIKAENAHMDQVQQGRVGNAHGGDAHANRGVSDQSYGRGMDDNTASAMDQCDEESTNNEDLSVQQAIINSLIDF
ncbi:hypothetical protein AK88_02904 [Plasmodium fragile]|uniref:Uncharacterized protein n=1 Tax=Plasmodium fragile TaxID=5857 RepID=A0A0D9QKY5_PLAFR|nr:uncharacterized protein AK88_02904 [Plasmodium fragile]KJP87472.1 hypothetical protein AK88_02904 [Plasmodium fragile]